MNCSNPENCFDFRYAVAMIMAVGMWAIMALVSAVL